MTRYVLDPSTLLEVVAPGRAADLLVVDGAPHHDIRAIRQVALVLRDGRTVADHRAEPGS